MRPVSSSGPPISAVAIIPARYQSSRLPGKVLADIGGRPMIEHVYRRAAAARTVASVIVATDDERIARIVTSFGGSVRMTSPAHQSGTDRVAEVARDLSCSIVVGVQGDEPLIEPAMIDEAVIPLTVDPALEMSTLRRRIDDPADFRNPHVTKVVVDQQGYALYFSRSPIPFLRDGGTPAVSWRHVGLYVYRRDSLLRLSAFPQTLLEKSEALEQLRALEHGMRILAPETRYDSIGVDTPEDLERARRIVAESGLALAEDRLGKT